MGRQGKLLCDHLQSVPHPHRHQPAIQNRGQRTAQAGPRDGFPQHGRDRAQHRHHRKLLRRQGKAIVAGGCAPHQNYMRRPEKGARQHQQIALLHVPRAGYAEQIQPHGSQHRAHPNVRAVAFLQHQRAHQRHEHHVQAGNEARLARGGVNHPNLLQRRRDEQRPPQEQAIPPGRGNARGGSIAAFPRRAQANDARQHRRPQRKTHRVERKRRGVQHAHPLRDKTAPPHRRRDKQHDVCQPASGHGALFQAGMQEAANELPLEDQKDHEQRRNHHNGRRR